MRVLHRRTGVGGVSRTNARTCTHHCRSCGSHFTSLAAFDAHRPKNGRDGGCEWPDDAPLCEVEGGECRIASARSHKGVLLWEHKNAARARERFGAAA